VPRAESSPKDSSPDAGERFLDADLVFLQRFAGPIMLVARIMLAYIFVVSGATYVGQFAGVSDYMRANGVDPRLLPLVILTEFGGGLLVLFGLKTRWAAIALCGFCVLTAFLIHWRAGELIEVQKNVAMAGGFLALASFGPGPWSIDGRRGG
jgi:putative oxidoreductase